MNLLSSFRHGISRQLMSVLEEITVEHAQNRPNKYNHRMWDSSGILAISVYPGFLSGKVLKFSDYFKNLGGNKILFCQ